MPAGTRHLQSRLKTAIGQYRDAHKSLRSASSKRSGRGLDWTNFFIADVQTGFGTYVAFYLAQRGWSRSDVGWALTIGGLAGVLSQIPGGALADATTWKRGLITVGIVTIGAAALILAFSSSFVLVLFAERLHGITAGITGRLSIGFYTSLSAGNLRAALVEYMQQFPQIEIEMIERSRTRLTSGLLNGAIDAAIVTGERALLSSSSMPLWSERLLLVLPKNHRLAEKQVVSWTDLVGEVLLLGRRDPGPAIQEYLCAKLVSPEDRPRIVWQDVSRESIKSLVGAHLGIGLTLEASLGTNSDGIVHREIRDGGGSARIGLCVNWQDDNANPALANFLNLLRRRYPSSF